VQHLQLVKRVAFYLIKVVEQEWVGEEILLVQMIYSLRLEVQVLLLAVLAEVKRLISLTTEERAVLPVHSQAEQEAE
jgi:hypothetical protein